MSGDGRLNPNAKDWELDMGICHGCKHGWSFQRGGGEHHCCCFPTKAECLNVPGARWDPDPVTHCSRWEGES
jgi:hypothetical protein